MIQTEVQEIKYQEVYIEKLRKKAIKTHKIRDWLSLLNAYHENSDFKAKNQTIQQMNQMFILKQEFWLKQTKRLVDKDPITEDQIQIAMLAFSDGFYEQVAIMIYKRLEEQIDVIVKGHKSHIRTNYIIAKIQQLSQSFRHLSTNRFLSGLRSIYIKLKNQKKIRQTFQRQIKAAYDNVDIAYDFYKNWQQKAEELEKAKAMYEEAKIKWEDKKYFLETKNYKMIDLRIALLELENTTPFDSIKYYEYLSELQTDTEKLWFLRRASLGNNQLSPEYLEKLEMSNIHDEETLISIYQNVANISQECQMPYLRFLVRRINKHLLEAQDDEYQNEWGIRVVFFREQIARLIDKPRLTPNIQKSMRQILYNYWVDVETALIQDEETIVKLFTEILRQRETVENYKKYSQSLLRLGKYKETKNILKKCCDVFKIDFQAQKQYQNFIAIYGTIDDFNQLKRIKNLQFSEENKQPNLLKPQKMQMDPQLQEEKSSEQHKQISKEKQPQDNEQPKKKIHTDSPQTLFIKNIPTTFKEEDVKNLIKFKNLIQQIRMIEKNGIPQSYCYVEMDSEESAKLQLQQNQYKQKYYIALSKPPSAFSQAKTLFLAALPPTATQEKIKHIFQDYQQSIEGIRMILNSQKNIAFIDFSSQEQRNKTYEKFKGNNLMIDGKKVLLKECQHREKKKSKVILMKHLSFFVKESDIEKFFKGKEIEQIFIPKREDGRSKGFAFVEFEHYKDYHEALEKGTGMLRNRQFQIVKSDREIQLPKQKKDNSFFSDMFKQ